MQGQADLCNSMKCVGIKGNESAKSKNLIWHTSSSCTTEKKASFGLLNERGAAQTRRSDLLPLPSMVGQRTLAADSNSTMPRFLAASSTAPWLAAGAGNTQLNRQLGPSPPRLSALCNPLSGSMESALLERARAIEAASILGRQRNEAYNYHKQREDHQEHLRRFHEQGTHQKVDNIDMPRRQLALKGSKLTPCRAREMPLDHNRHVSILIRFLLLGAEPQSYSPATFASSPACIVE